MVFHVHTPDTAVPTEFERSNPGAGLGDRIYDFAVRRTGGLCVALLPVLAVSLWLLASAYLLGGGGEVYHVQGDFQVYRWAVHTWMAGGDIVGDWASLSNGKLLPWGYPPFALLPLSAFVLLPLNLGVLLLWAVNLLAIGTTLYLVTRHLWPAAGTRGALAVTAAGLPFTLLLEPVHSGFGQGQINLMLMGLIALDCLARTPRWPRGLLIGVAAAIKLTPAAFLLFFLLLREVRAVITVVFTALACTLVGFALDFRASLDYWFRSGPAASVAGHPLNSNQSVMGALARFDLHPMLQNTLWAVTCLALVVVAVGPRRPRRRAVGGDRNRPSGGTHLADLVVEPLGMGCARATADLWKRGAPPQPRQVRSRCGGDSHGRRRPVPRTPARKRPRAVLGTVAASAGELLRAARSGAAPGDGLCHAVVPSPVLYRIAE